MFEVKHIFHNLSLLRQGNIMSIVMKNMNESKRKFSLLFPSIVKILFLNRKSLGCVQITLFYQKKYYFSEQYLLNCLQLQKYFCKKNLTLSSRKLVALPRPAFNMPKSSQVFMYNIIFF